MNKLPTEVIIELTSRWSFKDKLNLACTCKHLHRIVSENTLYNKLVFKDKVKFDQAMEMNNNKNILQQVRDLCIGNMKYDTQLKYDTRLISALPTLFPRVRFLKFESDPNESASQTTGIDANKLEVTATSWKNVEKITDCSNLMNVTIRLLPFLTFDQLRRLEISCRPQERPNVIQRHKRTQALIQAIHNAPALKELVLHYPVINIIEMEDLHARATKLALVAFNYWDFRAEDAVVENQFLYQPATVVESFTLLINSMAPPQLVFNERMVTQVETLGRVVRNWIVYIGIKYPQLTYLFLNMDLVLELDLAAEEKELITTALATALTNMKFLKTYSVDLPCHLQPVLDIMTSNNVQLERFGFLVDINDSIQEKFTSIQSAHQQPLSSVSLLEIYCDDHTDTLSMVNPLMNLSNSLKHLTDLDFTSCSDKVVILFIDVMQNLTMLKRLHFGALLIQKETTDDLFYNKVSNIHTVPNVESICLYKFSMDEEGDNTAIKKMYRLFAFILQSCPNLKAINLIAEKIGYRGEINLDFRGNALLQHIKLDLPGCRYYRFHHEFGKCWRHISEEIEQDANLTLEQEQDLPFTVNLACDTTMDIDMQLFGCGL